MSHEDDEQRTEATDGDAAPRLRLTVLGGFGLTRGGADLVVPLACQRLVGLLALEPVAVDRALAAARLWPETDDDRARHNLRSVLWRLRRSDAGALLAPGPRLGLAPTVGIDLAEGLALAHRLMAHAGGAPGPAELLHADVLPDWDDEWVRASREHYRQARLHALEELSAGLLASGRYGEAVEAALEAVAADPLRETAQIALIRAHLAEGNEHEALRRYRECRRVFLAGLGSPPTRRLDDLIEPALALR